MVYRNFHPNNALMMCCLVSFLTQHYYPSSYPSCRTGTGGTVREFIADTTEKLALEGHEISWGLVGTRLAHGKCLHCELPVAVEGVNGRFSLRIGSVPPCQSKQNS